MPYLARLGRLARLSLVIVREAFYQMNKYQYEARSQKISRGRILLGVFTQNILINILGLAFSIGLFLFPGSMRSTLSYVDPVSLSLFSFSSFIILLTLFAVFSSSWMIQTYGSIDPLLQLPLSRRELSLSYLFSNLYGIIWVFIALPTVFTLLYMRGVSSQHLLAAIYTPLLSLLLGLSIGMLLSTLIGGRKYSGPSKKAYVFQFFNILVYSLVFIVFYQFYYLSRFFISFTTALASIRIPDVFYTVLFPFNLFNVGQGWSYTLLPLVIWTPILYKLSIYSVNRFIGTLESPVYITIGYTGEAELRYATRGGYLMGLMLKDFRMLIRDIRHAPLLIMPFIIVFSMLIGPIQYSGEGLGGQSLVVSAYMVMAFVIPLSILGITRIDRGNTWILFSHGLDKSHYFKGKLMTALMLSTLYVLSISAVALFYTIYQFGASQAVTQILELTLDSVFVLSTSLIVYSIYLGRVIGRMTYDGEGLEPDLMDTMVTLIYSMVNAGVFSLTYFIFRQDFITRLIVTSVYIVITGVTAWILSKKIA